MKYLISYDLRTPGKDYTTLYQALSALNAHRVLLSQWVTKHPNANAAGLRDYLRQYTDANDRVLVVSLDSGDWAGWNLEFNPNNLDQAA